MLRLSIHITLPPFSLHYLILKGCPFQDDALMDWWDSSCSGWTRGLLTSCSDDSKTHKLWPIVKSCQWFCYCWVILWEPSTNVNSMKILYGFFLMRDVVWKMPLLLSCIGQNSPWSSFIVIYKDQLHNEDYGPATDIAAYKEDSCLSIKYLFQSGIVIMKRKLRYHPLIIWHMLNCWAWITCWK